RSADGTAPFRFPPAAWRRPAQTGPALRSGLPGPVPPAGVGLQAGNPSHPARPCAAVCTNARPSRRQNRRGCEELYRSKTTAAVLPHRSGANSTPTRRLLCASVGRYAWESLLFCVGCFLPESVHPFPALSQAGHWERAAQPASAARIASVSLTSSDGVSSVE